jgi:uncharacterized protein
MPVIDIHEHVWTVPCFTNRPEIDPWTDAEYLISSMDRRGIDQMALLPLMSPESVLRVQSSEEIFEVCDRFPDRFIKFCNIDPRMGDNDPNYDFVPVLEHYKDLGAKGLGEITCNLWWDDARVQNLLGACEKVDIPVTFHLATKEFGEYGLVDEPELPGLERALQRFPGLKFFGHSAAFWCEIGVPTEEERTGYPEGKIKQEGAVPRLMRKYPNLYGDLSAGSGRNAIDRDKEYGPRFIDEFQDRLLMGMDLCRVCNDAKRVSPDALNDYRDQDAISQDVYDKVMGLNAIRLLKLSA